MISGKLADLVYTANGLRVHFKTPTRVPEANEQAARMKEANVEYRLLQNHTVSVALGFETCS